MEKGTCENEGTVFLFCIHMRDTRTCYNARCVCVSVFVWYSILFRWLWMTKASARNYFAFFLLTTAFLDIESPAFAFNHTKYYTDAFNYAHCILNSMHFTIVEFFVFINASRVSIHTQCIFFCHSFVFFFNYIRISSMKVRRFHHLIFSNFLMIHHHSNRIFFP